MSIRNFHNIAVVTAANSADDTDWGTNFAAVTLFTAAKTIMPLKASLM